MTEQEKENIKHGFEDIKKLAVEADVDFLVRVETSAFETITFLNPTEKNQAKRIELAFDAVKILYLAGQDFEDQFPKELLEVHYLLGIFTEHYFNVPDKQDPRYKIFKGLHEELRKRIYKWEGLGNTIN